MPEVFRHDGYRFFFYSNEGNPLEPPHVHVEKAGDEAKFWLLPAVVLAWNSGFSAKVLKMLVRIIEANKGRILKAWNGHFGQS